MPLIPLHHTTQTSMPPAGYKPAIPASEQPQAPALHSAATTIGPERKIDDCQLQWLAVPCLCYEASNYKGELW